MNTTTTTTRRDSEGTRTARAILSDTSRSQMPQPYLLDTGPFPIRRPAHKPLRLIKLPPDPSACGVDTCGFGTCALDPACTSRCRYREADEALGSHYNARHTQRAAMPEVQAAPLLKQPRRDLMSRLVWGAIGLWLVSWLGFAAWLAWPMVRALFTGLLASLA